MLAALFLTLLQTVPGDSLAAVREAQSAQAAFERLRRRQLPLTTSGGGRCDERIGRFCYWYDESEPPPPHEPPSIGVARAELLERLRALGRRAPANGWIVGQRVRYQVEHGMPGSALATARRCRAETWWCDALAGFAWHALGAYVEADSAFARALERMPEAVRCEWTDLRPLLEYGADAYAQLPCARRDSANTAILWLARPRLTVPGNDLRTEYFARRTYAQALDDAVTPHGRFSAAQREMMLRYGWEIAWSRRMPQIGAAEEDGVVGHEGRPSYAFLPVGEPGGGLIWDPARPRPRSRYAPAWARAVLPIEESSLSRFERGDSLFVVTAFAAARDTLFRSDSVTARLALSRGPGAGVRIAEGRAAGGRGALVAGEQGDSLLVSLEISESPGVMAVERVLVVRPTGGLPRLSDLLLYEPQTMLPTSLVAAAASALPAGRLPRGSIVGLYWEVYGLGAGGDSMGISVSVEELGAGLLTRIGRLFGLGDRPQPIRVAWRGSEGAGHTIELNLSQLLPGRYQVRVALEPPGQGRIEATREVRIVDPG